MAIREFKNDVKAVVDHLAQAGIQVQHTVMLEAISKGFGERGWSAHREALAALAKAGDTVAAQGETISPPAWRYEDGPMSDAQYVARKGTRCPVCGSDHIESESVEADGKDGWANVRCRECDASWSDSWQMTGYFDLQTPQAIVEPTPEEKQLYSGWGEGA
jgi:predicted transcriptional regulator